MEEKIIVFFINTEDVEFLGSSIEHSYEKTLAAIDESKIKIYTTQLRLIHSSLFEKGYRVTIRDKDGEFFEVKQGQNLEKLIRT